MTGPLVSRYPRPKSGFTTFFELPALGRRQTIYISFWLLAWSCVFVKQSASPIICDLFGLVREGLNPNEATLLPKLRVQSVEFLQGASLERLRLLASSTCVGFSTVTCSCPSEGISCGHGICRFVTTKSKLMTALRVFLHGFACGGSYDNHRAFLPARAA